MRPPAPQRQTAVYGDRMRNVVGLANYLTKNVKDRRKVEVPPQGWDGRRCRLDWLWRGFLARSKKHLWQAQVVEWYPQPVAAPFPASTEDRQDNGTVANTRPTAAPWPERRAIGPSSSLRLAVAGPVGFREATQPLDGIRAVQTARGP